MTVIYGIKSCDTMKRARAWLDAHKVACAFHDYKASGIDKEKLEGWVAALGWETVLNRAGTTFRKLPDADKEGLTAKKAVALMLAQPSMIKRPVLEHRGRLARQLQAGTICGTVPLAVEPARLASGAICKPVLPQIAVSAIVTGSCGDTRDR